MIGKISVKDIAGHVNLPLPTVFVMQRSAACIGFLDVPAYATAVALTVVNASGTAGTFPASKVDGIWSVNLPGSFFIEPGKVEHGVILKAYDSSQAEYLIGRGDLVIESADATPSPGETVTNITDRTLEGETFDLETGDGQYGAIKQLITKLGGTVAALAVMVAAHAAPPPGFTNDVYSADGVTWTRHGSINTRSSYVVTDTTPGGGGGLTTNDVENIIAGTHDEWVSGYGTLVPVDGQTNVFRGLLNDVVTVTLHWGPDPEMPGILTWLWDCDGQDVNVNTGVPFEDATSVTLQLAGTYLGEILYGVDSITFTRKERNKFGLARLTDLPQNAAVPRILLKGEDGKTYSLKIDENRALVIDEVIE